MTTIATTTEATTTEAAQTIPAPIRLGTVCHSCALVLVNDDDSHLDPEEADDVRATLAAIRTDEGADLTTEDVPDDAEDGYFRCAVCGDDCLDVRYRLLGWRA